ncbi:precorrin-6A synthase (deacetylating) [Tropicimonas marinistellae]|uniref:precorrin-6A synthase (deacetylating) n=1 Tax=Tropicimonas marinistellae TaxID=1739787 RepID=UPI00082C9455|nr:precorrin-6A synthase (deacetylating) [Tropicimonas marinistellae]
MRELALIGIGTGNPDHLTSQGVAAIRGADLILIPRKGEEKSELADLRYQICARVLGSDARSRIAEFDMPTRDSAGDYLDGVAAWHDAVAKAWTDTASEVPNAHKIALLIWGDPCLFDSALRVVERLSPAPQVSVVPGITAVQALCAAHRIPLNETGAPFIVTTGRRLREGGWPEDVETVAVMLDSACAFQNLAPDGITIWWGAYLGMAEELIVAGTLADAAPRILKTRAEARARHGWIMDTYLLRRRPA